MTELDTQSDDELDRLDDLSTEQRELLDGGVPTDGPWHRADETEPWASRFQHYLLSGPERTMLNTYNLLQRDPASKGHASSIPGSWTAHCNAWAWAARAALFDEHLRSQERSMFDVAYRQSLQRHRRRAQQLAEVSFNNAYRLLKLAGDRLKQVDDKELKDVSIFTLIQAMRAAAALSETALNAEAHTLALDDIVAGLESNHASTSTQLPQAQSREDHSESQ